MLSDWVNRLDNVGGVSVFFSEFSPVPVVIVFGLGGS
jgi:hypothetical protein